MAAFDSYDNVLAQIASGYRLSLPFWGEIQTATVAFGGNVSSHQRIATIAVPSLPGGLTHILPTRISAVASNSNAPQSLLIAKATLLGTLNIGTGAYTDGSSMPTMTEAGSSRAVPGTIMLEVTTALNATPGSVTVKYVDQAGNAAETAPIIALPASAPAGSAGCVLLNSGDFGATDLDATLGLVQSGGTSPTGIIKAYGIQPIFLVPLLGALIGSIRSNLSPTFQPVKLLGGDSIAVYVLANTLVGSAFGNIYCAAE